MVFALGADLALGALPLVARHVLKKSKLDKQPTQRSLKAEWKIYS